MKWEKGMVDVVRGGGGEIGRVFVLREGDWSRWGGDVLGILRNENGRVVVVRFDDLVFWV